METLDLEDFKYNQVNITSFRYVFLVVSLKSLFISDRFVDADKHMVQEVLSEMEVFSPVGSNILNKSGVSNKSFTI